MSRGWNMLEYAFPLKLGDFQGRTVNLPQMFMYVMVVIII
jgi:hypothetical protein